eukprot:m.296502 g.296502  ORF g.296502 m.296502 type:complete len:50 (-) comp15856_c0_seq12:23-172(-)
MHLSSDAPCCIASSVRLEFAVVLGIAGTTVRRSEHADNTDQQQQFSCSE